MSSLTSSTRQPIYIIILLILAGEGIFILPFVIARIFRSTFLEVFELTNTEIGFCFSIYGWVALFSYLFGGSISDRISPRILISTSLFITAMGGLYMSTLPNYDHMLILYGFFGFSTIFLFWSAMIKATRVWGGSKGQGFAFGFLDGGRGLVAASIGSVSILIFSIFFNVDIDGLGIEEKKEAFQKVLLFSSCLIVLISILCFFFLKNDHFDSKEIKSDKSSLADYLTVAKIPAVLLMMIIVLCGYVGYKTTDYITQYSSEILKFNEIDSAQVGAFFLYIRPVVGILIGLIADRTKATLWIFIGFILMFLGAFVFANGWIEESMQNFFFFSVFITALGTYVIRALYFAVLEEGKVPVALTGTAVGLVSFIGYTPDIFVGPITGSFIDNNPGILGFQYVFWMLTAFSFIGLIAAFFLHRISK